MRSILTTRPGGASDPLAVRLTELGYRVHAVPTVVTEPAGPGSELVRAVHAIDAYDWVVVTSAAGVRAVVERLAAIGRPPSRLGSRPLWAAVGPATAEALARVGLAARAVPPEANGQAIASAIAAVEPIRGRRVLLARSDLAAGDLPERLREAGGVVDDVVAYRTIEGPRASRPALAAALADPELVAVVFASGSAIRGLLALVDEPETDRVRRLSAITIGGVTSGVAHKHGLRVEAEAPSATVESLVATIVLAFPPAPEPEPIGSARITPTPRRNPL